MNAVNALIISIKSSENVATVLIDYLIEVTSMYVIDDKSLYHSLTFFLRRCHQPKKTSTSTLTLASGASASERAPVRQAHTSRSDV
jgi:hypothetical protein